MFCLDSGIVHFSDHTQRKLVNIFFVFIFSLPTKQNSFLSFSVFLFFFFLPELILDGVRRTRWLRDIVYKMSLDLLSEQNFHFMCNSLFAVLTLSELERRYY